MAKCKVIELSPLKMLIFFTTVNILIYLDRGALAAVVTRLTSSKDHGLNLSSLEAGSLGSVFILGYMIASPIFAYNAQFIHPLYLMSIGLGMWCGSVLFTGLSTNF